MALLANHFNTEGYAAAAKGSQYGMTRAFRFQKTFADLAAANLVNDVELFLLPAGWQIRSVKMRNPTNFQGGTIVSVTLSVGPASNLVKYSPAFNVLQATAQSLSLQPGVESHTAATSIRLAAVAVGGNLDALVQGVADVWVEMLDMS